jgi:hypothetical protein
MTHLQQDVIAKLQDLSPENLEKVLQFVETISPPESSSAPRKNLRGRFAHLGVHITAEDISAARKEDWASFPRDISRD